jgi:hypothetical protein
MIEIFSIFLSVFIFLLFFFFPLNNFNSYLFLNTKSLKLLNIFDFLLINIIINLTFLLACSFFSINLILIFYLYLLLASIFFLYYAKKIFFLCYKNSLIIFFFLIIYYSLSVHVAADPSLTWDAAAHWMFKVQNYYQGGHYKNLFNVPFNHYPHLGSYIWAFFWKNSFLQLEYFGRFFYIFIFLVAIFSLVEQLNLTFSLIERLLFILFICYLSTNYFLFGGYQEYLLFFLLFSFSRIFILSQSIKVGKCNLFFFLLILISNLILWTKQEGFFYYIFLNIIYLIHANQNFKNKFNYIFISLIFLSLFFYIKINFFGSIVFQPEEKGKFLQSMVSNLNILYLFKKIFLIIKYILISIFKYPICILILISSVILNLKYNYFNKNKFLYTSLFLFVTLIFGIYIQTTLDTAFLLSVTLNRIIFGLSGFYIFILVEFLKVIKK